MNENDMSFIRLPNGEYVPDRRSTNTMELQATLVKLVGKVESMEQMVETKLEAVKDKISNIDEKLETRIAVLEEKFDEHNIEEKSTDAQLAEHDRKLTSVEMYIEKIHSLERKYVFLSRQISDLDTALKALAEKPQKEIYSKWTKVKDKVFWAIIGFAGTAFLYIITHVEALKAIITGGK